MLWHPMAVLPNVEIGESIEAPNAAFVAAHDARIKEINDKHSNFALFLESFADAFGETLTPSILLLHPTTALNFMTVGSVASLRDILSVSVIPRARSRAIQGLPLSSVAYSNSFDFYPWMLDRNYRHLIAITPAILALDEVRKFKGQPSPEVNRKT